MIGWKEGRGLKEKQMGFLSQIDEVIAACSHAEVQRAMFSATLMPGVEELARSVLRHPIKAVIGTRNAATSAVEQRLVFCGTEDGKLIALKQLFSEGIRPPVILFVQSKERAYKLHKELVLDGINADLITADRTKAQRDQAVENFRAGRTWVLIATDLMGRGMDFKGVSVVINYDFPTSVVQYIHRVGRTGRAGRTGLAITFHTADDVDLLRGVANVMKLSGTEVPDWMLRLPKLSFVLLFVCFVCLFVLIGL
jgi:ATP-dependent RNA helicase DDX52/ROK1